VNYALSTRASQIIRSVHAAVLQRTNAQRGASLVEYVLLISLMALAVFVAAKYLGTSTARPYSGAASGLQG
jgi:Flp pilus assembly pilin Flp